jgi:squalene-hopene/tetraprenyl-beta-curcumene cyclase
MALHRADPRKYKESIERAVVWVLGMQSKNGGWGAFDVDNTHTVLNNIPFADHGALLDPPTADVSARCLGFLAQVGYDTSHPSVARAIAYLLAEQEPDGSWFGRWGANYIYGTWSVLAALNAAGLAHDHPAIKKAAGFLKAAQREDGGWGEDLETYEPGKRGIAKVSTASQTAWACLALMAAGETHSDAVARGIAWLRRAPRTNERWHEEFYTGVGFPRVFYLRYHGYAAYFPLWAMARYAKLKPLNDPRVAHGL